MVTANATDLPRLVVAAPASGLGKTTVATGLMAALRRRGLTVSPHKVGPDYIDPGYHALACGRPGRNLDPWLVGPERIPGLLRHGAETPTVADVAVVEGVMGLYDGVSGRSGYGSTAHVAQVIGAPVLVVLDVQAQVRTAAAVVAGMQVFDPTIRIGGVVLNRVGSAAHERWLREAMAERDVPVLGAIPRSEAVRAPSRHLGLIPVAERAEASLDVVSALAALITEHLDLDAVLDLARSAEPLTAPAWDAAAEIAGSVAESVAGWGAEPGSEPTGGLGGGDRPRIAVAAGAAFTFGYAEGPELLTAAGAEVVGFDPLTDPALPPGTRAVVIGGGFPEQYAVELSANVSLREHLATFEGPIHAECAGLLYLARSLDDVPMCGRLPVHARMTPQLTLGYREAVAGTSSVLAEAGQVVRGHEFHRTATVPGHSDRPAWRWEDRAEGFVVGAVHASYLHTHPAGNPSSARRFVDAARAADR